MEDEKNPNLFTLYEKSSCDSKNEEVCIQYLVAH